MNKKRAGVARIAALVFLFGILLLLFLNVAVRRRQHWNFEESRRSIANPERGFYIQVDSSRPDRISAAAEEVRLILLAFDIEGAEKELPEERLDELRRALETAREEHVAVIFRAAYGFQSEVTEPERLEQMGTHIRQISEVLNAYPDQILVVQAGMLGAYGEWHSSRYLDGTEEEKRESRLFILRQWETYLEAGIKVAVRRPRFVREAMEAGILSGRLGLHNDALLSTDSDMGSYDDPGMEREEELLWAEAYLTEQVNGGEMPVPGPRNTPENTHYEFGLLHIGYLNLKYNEEIISGWSKQDMEGMNAKCFLENHIGYRLFLAGLDMRRFCSSRELSDGSLEMQISLCNSGYACLPDRYRVYVTMESGERQAYREIEIPELYSVSNNENITAKFNLEIPETFLNSGETIVIGLKIASDMEVQDGRDCVEFANDGFAYRNGANEIAAVERLGRGLWRCRLAE